VAQSATQYHQDPQSHRRGGHAGRRRASYIVCAIALALTAAACGQAAPAAPTPAGLASPVAGPGADDGGASGVSAARVSAASGSYRILGTVNYVNGFKYGRAAGAAVEVIDSQQRVVGRTWAGTAGAYEVYAPGTGTYRVRATFSFEGRTLSGTSPVGVVFTRAGQQATGVNITVR
jgi:hypothetical protein